MLTNAFGKWIPREASNCPQFQAQQETRPENSISNKLKNIFHVPKAPKILRHFIAFLPRVILAKDSDKHALYTAMQQMGQ